MVEARKQIGKHPYLWGAKGCGPTDKQDCSGALLCWILAAGGPGIGAGTWFQRQWCKNNGVRATPPYVAGDILFFMDEGPETPSHVGIATGEGTVIEETATYGNVVESSMSPRWRQQFIEAWRIPEWSA